MEASLGICLLGFGVCFDVLGLFSVLELILFQLGLKESNLVFALFCWMGCVFNLGNFWSPGTRLE